MVVYDKDFIFVHSTQNSDRTKKTFCQRQPLRNHLRITELTDLPAVCCLVTLVQVKIICPNFTQMASLLWKSLVKCSPKQSIKWLCRNTNDGMNGRILQLFLSFHSVVDKKWHHYWFPIYYWHDINKLFINIACTAYLSTEKWLNVQ